MAFNTNDICDDFEDTVRVVAPIFNDYGGNDRFAGVISTIKCHEDNSRVREAVAEPGEGRVLVVDGGGSLRCALLGDMLAAKGRDNGWAGILVYGCVRDTVELGQTAIGVKALNTLPKKSVKKGIGERDVEVHFADVTFKPGQYLYADLDGVIVLDEPVV